MLGYRMPTRVLIEVGCLARLPEGLEALGCRSALLVIDPGMRGTEWPDRARKDLAGIRTETFADVEPNPRTSTAEKAAGMAREAGLAAVIGLGGGSVLDCAKAASMLATNPGTAKEFEGRNRFRNRPLPFVAIPSTCGTGSEVTWVSVLSHQESRSKISVKGEAMFPTQALVDADLLRSLPAHLVASTGLDALTHALEATTCTERNPVSDAFSEKAIALLFAYLPRAVADIGGDDEAREAVMRASTLAGLSFGNADVAAVHCLSETIGGMHDLPHGLLNAVLLGKVMRSHLPAIEGRLAELQRLVGPASAMESPAELALMFLDGLDRIARTIEIPSFASLGVPRKDFPEIAQRSTQNGSHGSNPRPMTQADYLTILEELVA